MEGAEVAPSPSHSLLYSPSPRHCLNTKRIPLPTTEAKFGRGFGGAVRAQTKLVQTQRKLVQTQIRSRQPGLGWSIHPSLLSGKREKEPSGGPHRGRAWGRISDAE